MKQCRKQAMLLCLISLAVCLLASCAVRDAEKAAGEQAPIQAESWQDIVLTFWEQQLHGVLFANETARLFAEKLPLNVELWNPAPGFAKAFDLPEAIPDIEPHTRAYELGGLAYWYPGPSVAVFHSDHLDETIVPVVPIGRITDDVGFLADYEGSLSISLAP